MKKLLAVALAAFALSACSSEFDAYRNFDYDPPGPMQLWKVAECGRYGEAEWLNIWATFPPPSYDCLGRAIPPMVIQGVPNLGGVVIIVGGSHHHGRRHR